MKGDPMKRLFVFALAILVLASGMAAAEEKKPNSFRVYLDEKNMENFLNALQEYEAKRADTLDMSATIVISYLHMLELERNLEMLEENEAGLSDMNKFQYANILLELKEYDNALGLYKQINEKTPKWSCPWRHRGEAHWKKKEYEDAVMCLEKAIETRETHFDAYTMLAHVLYEMEDYEKAFAVMEKGMTYYGKDIEDPEREVDMVETYFLYLDLCEKVGNTERYEEIYSKLKERVPEDERLKK
jgi:tetratricopeptide (TPR) repeat protein